MPDRGRGRTILIVEPHLEGQFGHPWRYAHALVRRFSAAGWSVRILAHSAYDGSARILGAPVSRVFPRSYYEHEDRGARTARWRYGRRERDRAQSTLSPFATTVRDAIVRERRRAEDVRVLVPTATPAILAELSALPVLLDGDLPRIALLFHEEPDLYTYWYRPLRLDALRLRLRGSGWGDALRCFATNEPLARHLATLLDAEVEAIGDVFDDGEIARLRAVADHPAADPPSNGGAEVVDRLRALKRAGRRVAWCPGQMRPDKGADRLRTVVQALDTHAAPFHLVVQAPLAANGRMAEVEALDGHPRVTVIRGELSDAAYDALLGLTDVILLPYDATVYARRVSRVFLEAALARRLVVASAGMAAQHDACGGDAAFVTDWTSWPVHAAALLERCGRIEPSADEAPGRFVEMFTRWHTMVDWLVAPVRPSVAARPVLYIRPAALGEAASAVCDEHLAHFASCGVPVVELLIAPPGRGRRALRDSVVADRAGSAAQLTAWASGKRGALGLLQRLLVLMTSVVGRRLSVRHGGSGKRVPVGRVVHEVHGRRRYALIVVVDHEGEGPIVSGPRGVPVRIETIRAAAKAGLRSLERV